MKGPCLTRTVIHTDIALLGALDTPQTSGYCECEDGVHVAPSACQHKSFTCGFKCLGCTNATVYRISQMGDDGCSTVGLQPVQLVEGANRTNPVRDPPYCTRTSGFVPCPLQPLTCGPSFILDKPRATDSVVSEGQGTAHSRGRKPSRRKLRSEEAVARLTDAGGRGGGVVRATESPPPSDAVPPPEESKNMQALILESMNTGAKSDVIDSCDFGDDSKLQVRLKLRNLGPKVATFFY